MRRFFKRKWKEDPAYRKSIRARLKLAYAAQDAKREARAAAHEALVVKYVDGTRLPPLPGCTGEQARWFWRQARFEATMTMKKLIKAGVITEDDDNANKALHYALSVMKAPVEQKVGLQAASIVLTYTKSKPVAKSEISISKAEEWLDAVVADNEQITEDAVETGDPEASS